MRIEIAKFTFPKMLKTGNVIESEPYNCRKFSILGLSAFPEKFLYKDLGKLLKRTLLHFFVDEKIYLKLPLSIIPFYPYPFNDCKTVPFYDLRIPTLDKTINDRLLPLLANEVMCKLEIIDEIYYYEERSQIEIIDTSPIEINKDSILYIHLTTEEAVKSTETENSKTIKVQNDKNK